MKLGLALLSVWFIFSILVPFTSSLFRLSLSLSQVLALWVVPGSLGLAGLAMLVLSTFLPSRRTDKPTFIQELMSKEKLQYGVYTEGNWRSVLDEEAAERGSRISCERFRQALN